MRSAPVATTGEPSGGCACAWPQVTSGGTLFTALAPVTDVVNSTLSTVVGGTPVLHQELSQLLAGGPTELRAVDGTSGNHTTRMAETNMDWAQLVVIWASTPLPHKVSDLYTTPLGRRAVVVHRRGIEALCEEIVTRLG